LAATVYLSLGTNLGERQANLKAAEEALHPEVEIIARSPIYETPPWGYTDQPAFLNQVLVGCTELPPMELIRHLKEVEERLGRVPSFRYGPRLIDMDILFFDDLVLDSPDLAIPHPRLHERAFVLAPLADLAPDLRHPVLNKSVRELLQALDTSGIKRFKDSKHAS
jgi:2-amino-4-hydroxy-6-hydroxymethyldihydropteridine diphosphokinase